MKRIAILSCLIVLSALSLRAQVISYDMIQRNMNINVKLTLKDAKTSEPISWASVYLIPQGDTTITHFALSDDKGDVELKDVPTGKYELNAEMIGYLPHKKVYTFKKWQEDLGIIKLEENAEYLDAATVSAAGNAIMVKQDTIIYNASSFKVGENDMLADLLKKMPGVEVGSDGSVTVNGEKVDKITVGGKTFFFDDPTAALSNLPAKIVDKIKVVDKDKDAAEFSGVSTQDDKEKVMDVELKDEYSKGWFGNAKLGGGATLTPKTDDKLIDDRGLLYNGNAMVSGYTEKDQIVFIGNAFNATEPGSQTFMVYGLGDMDSDFAAMRGINSSAQAGANYSTERIKGFETTVSANYKNNAKDAATRSARTSYQNDGQDLYTDGSYDGFGNENAVSINMELKKKDTKKFMLHFVPAFKYSDSRVNSSNTSRTYSEEGDLNSSTSSVSSHYKGLTASGWLDAGIKDLGKKRRSLTMDMSYEFSDRNGTRTELSEIIYGGSPTLKDLLYRNSSGRQNIEGTIAYVEPFGEKWALQTMLSSAFYTNSNIMNAFNPDGTANDYYTSTASNRMLQERATLLLQYDNDTLNVQAGLNADLFNNEVHARQRGVETVTGKDEWLLNWSPFAALRYKKDSHNLRFYYSGYVNPVTGSTITPNLDISDPIQIKAGNIYLKPGFDNHFSATYAMNDRETFSFLNVNLYGSLGTNSRVDATWFDDTGVRYAIPVNSKKPVSTTSLYVSYNIPIGKERRFTFSTYGWGTFQSSAGYQAKGRLEGLDLQNFDYGKFMEGFWGDASGNRFYSGESGFSESRTNTYNWGLQASLKYSIDKLDATLSAQTGNRISKYSLDPDANVNNWASNVGVDLIYSPGKDWEIKTDFRYLFYNGYTAGYGDPEWRWNLGVSKTIKSVTLSLKAADLLNQTKSLQRTTTAEYMEDVYSRVLGRYFLFGVSFNFGKMNSKKNSRVENAMWRGMW